MILSIIVIGTSGSIHNNKEQIIVDIHDTNHLYFDTQITVNELHRVLVILKPKKLPGPDGIPYKFLTKIPFLIKMDL